MFGTFEPEVEATGLRHHEAARQLNPLWANFGGWIDLARDAWHAPRLRDKFKIWFMPLGWTPPGLPERPRRKSHPRHVKKYDPQLPRGLNAYVLVQFTLVLVLGIAVTTLADQHAPWRTLLPPAAFVLWSLGNLGGILEQKGWGALQKSGDEWRSLPARRCGLSWPNGAC